MPATLFHNASIFTPLDAKAPLSGPRQGKIMNIPHGAMLVRDGSIAAVGDENEIFRLVAEMRDEEVTETNNLGGGCVIPGFVDPHTHMCFARRRENEFRMRIAGAEYLDILKAGGGILRSVKDAREASDEDLLRVTLENIQNACRSGTTSLEIKSGYGLNLANELRMLRIIAEAGALARTDVTATFMGAHAVPDEYKNEPEKYVDLIINEMLPAVAEQGIARYCDVFCEQGAFGRDQCRRILSAARDLGLGLKIHADEVHDLGGAELAAEMRAVSAEHLLAADAGGLLAMAAGGVIAVLLPATAYSLRKPYARGRDMINMNLPVALATDCNPGSCLCESMPFVFGLAVMNMGLTPEEALTASTLNAAYAVGDNARRGSLEPGKEADFLLLDGESPAAIAYHAGTNPVRRIYKRGRELVADNPQPCMVAARSSC
jgi:imidazolonepropionase